MNTNIYTQVARFADECAMQVLSMHGAGSAAVVLLGDVDAQRYEVLTIKVDDNLLDAVRADVTITVTREERQMWRYEKAKKVFLDRARDFEAPVWTRPREAAPVVAEVLQITA